MFCTNCGKPVEAHYNVCPFCGASVNAAPTQNATFTEQPAFTAQPTFSASNSARAEELANSALTMGIVGLALCEFGLPGLIISRIGLNKANEVESLLGKLPAKANVGRILAKIGLGFSIGMMVFWILYFFILLIAMM